MKKNSSYWYCPKCKEELDGCHVTYQELCEYCGTAVLSVPESISQETIEEIIKAKAEGRLVVLPCKVGDTVYAVYGYLNKSIGTAIVKQICVRDNEIRVVLNNSIEKIWGRSVFATQEEAEKALGGAEDGK